MQKVSVLFQETGCIIRYLYTQIEETELSERSFSHMLYRGKKAATDVSGVVTDSEALVSFPFETSITLQMLSEFLSECIIRGSRKCAFFIKQRDQTEGSLHSNIS